jgi:beta-galactosidase/beta-glucuronidase
MNLKHLFILSALALAPRLQAQVSFGQTQKLNHDWRFSLSDDSLAARTDYPDADWRTLDVPHDWSIEGQLSPDLASCTGYLPGGIGWYRKHFTVADSLAKHYIYFEGVYNRSEVYLNGHLLGKRPNGYASFLYEMTPYLQPGDNVLAVRVDHSRYADSRWYTGSGIYRDVYLVAAPETHIAQWGVGYECIKLTNLLGQIRVNVEVENPQKGQRVQLVLEDASGKEVIKNSLSLKAQNQLILNILKPRRWKLDDPYMYRLHTRILAKDGTVVDESTTNVGLRTLQFDANKGFALNGEWMKVKGVCLHHDAGVLGAAVPQEVWERRLKALKEIGVNAIRMSHNPQAPIVYDLCDRFGLLVMDEASDEWEFPKRKWTKGWNQGEPSFDGTYDFFEEWIDRDVTDMVRRDRNHPSIFLWSIGNEVDYPNDPYSHPILDGSSISQPMFGGYDPKAPNAERIGKIAKRLAACVRSVDTSRPVTGALAGVVMSNQTEYPEAVDVVGYNYTEDRYDQDHATYPNRIIYGSENRPDIDAWYAVRDKDFIFGQFIWTGTDYLGESNPWPSRGFHTGLLDFASFIKPRGYFRQSLWTDKPMAYIGTYPKTDGLWMDAYDSWNYTEGQEIRVVCYTNTAQARLLLNGKEVGAMKPYDAKTGIIHWDIPFAPGVLMVEGCDANGQKQAAYRITTSGKPYALRAKALDKAFFRKPGEVAQILVEIVDEAGYVVKLGESEITCTVEGSAKLLGLEGCNNADMSDYTDNVQNAYHGTLVAYIQSIEGSQPVKLTFTSPELVGVVLELPY